MNQEPYELQGQVRPVGFLEKHIRCYINTGVKSRVADENLYYSDWGHKWEWLSNDQYQQALWHS